MRWANQLRFFHGPGPKNNEQMRFAGRHVPWSKAFELLLYWFRVVPDARLMMWPLCETRGRHAHGYRSGEWLMQGLKPSYVAYCPRLPERDAGRFHHRAYLLKLGACQVTAFAIRGYH
jgi:hypothetical protein